MIPLTLTEDAEGLLPTAKVRRSSREGWVHLRKSNTEPIVRVYTEAPTPEAADALAERFKAELLVGG
ncbi:MAG TPA: hypothetical protein VK002_10055 [Rubricoccaceae bacterium]|nr:hypothetical protein [Rubricoccaceae bacterium]